MGPRLPVAMSSLTPVRDVWSAPRDLSAPSVALCLMVAHETAQRPDHGPYFTSRCYDVAPALAGLKPVSDGISGAKDPAGSASRYCGDTARPWYLRVYFSRRLEPPMALDDLGLALPSRALRSFPGDFGFLRRPLPQPANSQVPEYRNAYAAHPPHRAYPRNPPTPEKTPKFQSSIKPRKTGCRTHLLEA